MDHSAVERIGRVKISGKEQNAIYLCFIQLFQWEMYRQWRRIRVRVQKPREQCANRKKAEVRLKFQFNHFACQYVRASRRLCATKCHFARAELRVYFIYCVLFHLNAIRFWILCVLFFSFSFHLFLWTTCESCHRLFSADSFSCYVLWLYQMNRNIYTLGFVSFVLHFSAIAVSGGFSTFSAHRLDVH